MDNYHVYERIGKGVNSEVYKGRKKKSIDYFAVKSVQLSQKRRVHQEVKTLHGLDHPNILRFHSWYETHNHLWLILEYCVGGDLKSLLKQDVCLPVECIHDFGRDLIAAMQYLHSRGIIHCDLKPSNILLDENGSLRLGGFGYARTIADINARPLLHVPPADRGTPAYMAPELFQQGAAQSTASDLWALGCILYECFTGRPPFMHPTFHELVRCILNTDPLPMHCTNAQFSDLVMRLLDKNPATRVTWVEMLTHPFWRFSLSPLQMPVEPALWDFIERNRLAPRVNAAAVSRDEGHKAAVRAKIMRQSVDITRLSQNVRGGKCSATSDMLNLNMLHSDAEVDFNIIQVSKSTGTEPAQGSGRMEQMCISKEMITGHNCGKQWQPFGEATSPFQRLHLGEHEGGQGIQAHSSWSAPHTLGCSVQQGPCSPSDAHDVRLSSLIFHRMDLSVRPLVGNRCIENWTKTPWEVSELPAGVEIWSATACTESVHIRAQDMETLVTSLSNNLTDGKASAKHLCNLLGFIESFATNEATAQSLLNSPITSCILEFFEHEVSSVRTQAATLLGMLIRFAPAVNKGIHCPALLKLQRCLQDSSAAVRRRAMMTLGELLFYLCASESDAISCGTVTLQAVVDTVVCMLHPSEDSVAQHYACRTIDNVLATSGFLPQQFASCGTALALAKLAGESGYKPVQAAASSAFARVLRYCPALCAIVGVQAGPVLLQCLKSQDCHVQVHALNALNMILVFAPAHSGQLPPVPSNRSELLQAVRCVSDSQSCPLLQPKRLLCCALLMRCSPQLLSAGIQADFLLHLEGAQRGLHSADGYAGEDIYDAYKESNLYTVECIEQVLTVLSTSVEQLVAEISGALSARADEMAAFLIPIFYSFITAPMTRVRAVSESVISSLSACLPRLWTGRNVHFVCSAHSEQARRTIYLLHAVLEALLHPQDLLLHQQETIIRHLVPAVCTTAHEMLVSCHESDFPKDACYNMARMLTELLMFYVTHEVPDVSDATLCAPADRSTRAVPQLLEDVLSEQVFPLLKLLMQSGWDPLPLYAQKVLAALLIRDTSYVEMVIRHGMVPSFFTFLSIESPNNNIHNIRVCRILILTRAVTSQTLTALRIPEKVAMVLAYAHENLVDAFLVPTAELSLVLLERAITDAGQVYAADAGQRWEGGANAALAGNVLSHISFCCQGCTPLAFLAADCLLLLSQLHVRECGNVLLSGEGLTRLIHALCGSGGPQSLPHTDTTAHILHRLLECLYNCGLAGKATASACIVSDLHLVVGHLTVHNDGTVRSRAEMVSAMFE